MRKTLLTLTLLSMSIGTAHAFLDAVTDKESQESKRAKRKLQLHSASIRID